MWLDFLRKKKILAVENFDTAKICSIRVGGIAALYLEPQDIEGLMLSVNACRENSVKYKVIGNCTNTAFDGRGFSGAVISTRSIKGYFLKGSVVEIECGALYSTVASALSEQGVILPPELCGIPASIGGMVRNNAGAYGACVADIIAHADLYFPEEGEIRRAYPDELELSYRSSSIIRSGAVLISAGLLAEKGNAEHFKAAVAALRDKRRASQPASPSLGSFYKRDGEIIPARLIDSLGLKGFSVGGAQISKKHAGFIINSGGASFYDILRLADFIEKRVFEEFSVRLTREAELVLD